MNERIRFRADGRTDGPFRAVFVHGVPMFRSRESASIETRRWTEINDSAARDARITRSLNASASHLRLDGICNGVVESREIETSALFDSHYLSLEALVDSVRLKNVLSSNDQQLLNWRSLQCSERPPLVRRQFP